MEHPSMYAQYKKERENGIVVETPKGFASAVRLNDHIYIEEIYVLPEYRKSKIASKLADEVAKIGVDLGYAKMLGSVCPTAVGATESLKVLLGYGFKLLSAEENLIYFEKEISNG